jgi:hypothetical protein
MNSGLPCLIKMLYLLVSALDWVLQLQPSPSAEPELLLLL